MIRRMLRTRLITIEDAAPLAELVQINREYLAPWEPVRGEDYFTEAGQRHAIEAALAGFEQQTIAPYVIVDDGVLVGRVTLSNIVRGAFHSSNLGYWVGSAHARRGFATAAVRDIMAVAFNELGLHRIEAGTLTHNVASQRVLERNGFVRFGLAPAYLNIAGQWQDHAMYQALNPGAS